MGHSKGGGFGESSEHSGNLAVRFQTWVVKVVRDTFEEAGIELANSATYQRRSSRWCIRSKNACIDFKHAGLAESPFPSRTSTRLSF